MKTQEEYDKVLSSAAKLVAKASKDSILSFMLPDKFCSNASEHWIDVYLTVTDRAMNLIGSTHGGYIACILDHWMGVGARCFADLNIATEGMTTADMQINFLGATKVGDQLRCHVEECHAGKRTVIVRASVYCKDKLVAIATQNLSKINNPEKKNVIS